MVALVAWAALSAWLFGGRGSPRRRWIVAAAGACGVASHLFLDCLTSFGTMWLVPFSYRRFALDWVFIIDPAFSGILLVATFGTWIWRRHVAGVAGAGLGLLAAYIALCASLHALALEQVRILAARLGEPVIAFAALPMPPDAFHWRGLIRTRTQIREARVVPLGGEPEWLEPEPAADVDAPASPHTPELAALAGMARFLSVRHDVTPDGGLFTFFDRQFSVIPGRHAYEVTIATDPAGRVIESRFGDTEAGARTALFFLLAGLIAASVRRWNREESLGLPE